RVVRLREHGIAVTLSVVRIPNPPAGVDWSTVVPGAYLYDVTGITATLTTSAVVGPMLDASGNARDGNYNGAGPASFVPGLVAGDLALQCDNALGVLGWYVGQI